MCKKRALLWPGALEKWFDPRARNLKLKASGPQVIDFPAPRNVNTAPLAFVAKIFCGKNLSYPPETTGGTDKERSFAKERVRAKNCWPLPLKPFPVVV
jgi:hypothetical protein